VARWGELVGGFDAFMRSVGCQWVRRPD